MLTVGMPCYDDFNGVYFSVQTLRLYHPKVKIVVVDNNPDSEDGKATKKFVESWGRNNCQYVPFGKFKSPAVKNLVFKHAETPYVLCMDCHVLLEKGALEGLIEYYKANPDTKDLIQGPLLYDDLKQVSTHMDPVWRGQMWGIWATDERGKDKDAEPFEIPMQGMGLFSCRKDAWLGFNKYFRGFGGEEGYIHEKFRQDGRKIMCLPFLRWIHRFERPRGVPYPLDTIAKFRNYLIGFAELGLDIEPLVEHFREHMPQNKIDQCIERVREMRDHIGGKAGQFGESGIYKPHPPL